MPEDGEGFPSLELGRDEIVCAVTGYTYNRWLPSSPYLDADGKQWW